MLVTTNQLQLLYQLLGLPVPQANWADNRWLLRQLLPHLQDLSHSDISELLGQELPELVFHAGDHIAAVLDPQGWTWPGEGRLDPVEDQVNSFRQAFLQQTEEAGAAST